MAIEILGADGTTVLKVDSTSNAGRVTLYDQYGNPMSDVHSLGNILNALNSAVTVALGGQGTVGINVSGTTGSLTLAFEATIDNTNWFAISVTPVAGGSPVTTTTTDGNWVASTAGYHSIRARISVFTSGSMDVSVVITPSDSKNVAQSITVAGALTTNANQGNPNTIGNSWPVEVTDGTNILGTPTHPVRTDPTGTTPQPVSGTVTANQGTAAALSGHWPVQVTDGTNVMPTADAAARKAFFALTDGTDTVGVTPASTAAVVTDPALVISVSPNSISAKDRAAMVAGTQNGAPIIGQSYGVGRIARIQRSGHIASGLQTLLAMDVVEGANVNSWLWTQSTTTMTIAQATGLLTLNNNATTTTGTFAILTSNKQFAWVNQAPVGCSFKALVTQTTNAVNELGFGAPTGTTAVINNGAFFRINTSGAVFAVTSTNGTETVSASLGTIIATTYYLFYVWIEDGGARFIIEDSSGIPLVDYFAPLTLGTPDVLTAVSHIPAFARVYTTGTAGSAPQTKITNFQAWQHDINTSMPFSEQMAGAGRSSNIDPTTFAQTQGLAAAAAAAAGAPTNTTVKYTTLGGEYQNTMTATSENLLGVFGYTVPSPYTLNITDIFMPPPGITTAFTTTATVMVWALQVANSTNPSTATGPRYALTTFSAAASAVAGSTLQGQALNMNFKSPIIVLPGQVVLVMLKVVLGAATGVYRGVMNINGYFS